MTFYKPFLTRKAATNKTARGERRRMVISLLGLICLVSHLPLSYGVFEKEQNEAFCSAKACYSVHLSKEKFAEANNECVKRGGNLVTIKSGEEAGYVYSLLQKLSNTTQINNPIKLWIGLQLKSKCVIQERDLMGFSWITGPPGAEDNGFINWLKAPKKTCMKELCVSMILDMNSKDNYKWDSGLCSNPVNGYICKFNFEGMCQKVVLAGPGFVEYDTPFSFKSSSLNLVPYGSSAFVTCDHRGEHEGLMLLCKKEDDINVYQWSNPRLDRRSLGPLCASEELGCEYNNGGCEHECVENPQNRSLSCRCKDGYVLASDLVSCVYPDHCQHSPCEQNCRNHQHGFECTCSNGFVLAKNKVNCIDVNECVKGPCNQTCINTLGSFRCECDNGFEQQDMQCIDIDECINSPCSKSCLNTHGSYHCSCDKGYVLASDKTSCLDVDECIDSPCAESCLNTIGSYECSCPKGLVLSSDNISCVLKQQTPNINDSDRINEDLDGDRETTSSAQRENTETSVSPDVKTIFFTAMFPDVDNNPGNSSMIQVTSGSEDGLNTILLVSIICACVVVLLLLTVVGGILCYRKRNTKKEETEKQPSATDNYCWVPEQTSGKAVNNDYR